jgi:hypothetical protein
MDDAMMENMMKELEHMMDSGEFEKAMDNVMEELFSKDLMYEPMKELSIKVTHRFLMSSTMTIYLNTEIRSVQLN